MAAGDGLRAARVTPRFGCALVQDCPAVVARARGRENCVADAACRLYPAAPMPTTCVIGAGGSGLVAAKVLLADGHDVRVFEREHELGGVWAPWRAFPGLTTQTPGAQFEFSDFAFPPDLDPWPPAADVHAYLRAYAEHFGVTERIAFGSEVLRLEPCEDGGWTVTARRAGETLRERFDRVVVSERNLRPSRAAGRARPRGVRAGGRRASCTALSARTPKRSSAAASSSSGCRSPRPTSPSTPRATAAPCRWSTGARAGSCRAASPALSTSPTRCTRAPSTRSAGWRRRSLTRRAPGGSCIG